MIAVVLLGNAGCVCSAHLPETSLTVDHTQLELEVASTPKDRACGLAYRSELKAHRGMLFVVPEPTDLEFWMGNTRLPLSIAFLDDNGQVLSISDARPLQRHEHYRSPAPARYAIEVNVGWFEEHGVSVGDLLSIELPEGLSVR